MNNITMSNMIRKGNVMGIIEKAMDKILLSNQHFQDYINNRFEQKGHIVVDEQYLQDFYYLHKNGLYFLLCDQMGTIPQVEDYDISDLAPYDVVMDIGANIGAFAMKAACRCRHVFAVEPLYADVLRKNVIKNGFKNITVLDMGLGINNKVIKYGREKYVGMHKLSYLRQLCLMHLDQPITFLKLDCEGSIKDSSGEFSIMPGELTGIRAIEVEVHHYEGRPKRSPFEDVIEKAGFKYTRQDSVQESILIHARKA